MERQADVVLSLGTALYGNRGLRAAWLVVCLAVIPSPACRFLNETGLNPGHVSGLEAKEIILDKTLITAAIFAARNAPISAAAVISTPDSIGIIDDEYYKRREVEACADLIFLWQYVSAFFGPVTGCSLEPDNDFFDP